MVGGGIGVTPYASILNDLVFGTSTNRYSGVACKKVIHLNNSIAQTKMV
jgi:ferredoxin-NADP reductase